MRDFFGKWLMRLGRSIQRVGNRVWRAGYNATYNAPAQIMSPAMFRDFRRGLPPGTTTAYKTTPAELVPGHRVFYGTSHSPYWCDLKDPTWGTKP